MSSSRQHRYFVYILGSSSGTLYVGITGDLAARTLQHKNHTFSGFTAKHDVNRLLYYEMYEQVNDAIQREKQLKGWRRENERRRSR
jgi:putative endonuclease